ncbi:hypothetical protein L202_05264 [Cryptococcus amylolentus CBS 6039]|uniref:Uncharacterized protein n=4 Tax=Cryptococcus TaxID=5206 RepID=A0A1E3HKH5_9TREE|nr:hypothetical protein L202_05264 [Cryptococcus amylolentus CBS 6039]XP_019028412.1 hypothetical protein L198_07656 [Cryptococcus wingfieldii CBS 7118]ODO04587.1 hypothetical protein I350_05193 [Cryptococcus amylolentus CBS 6273]TYJ53495.1 hypothetical protein B9479_005881 [Cryptococcus floricola]ODN76615.1 hypothetical protein L202_05264 [Cryptococcus amylolentus CBS 6039]ODN83957.1 hypothetical protein L198_07656 [Cryptococcus wingfieldii CBS 7118]
MSTAPARSAPPPPEEDSQGASPNEILLAAAKSDNEGMLNEALEQLEDVNEPDGLGNTALHYAIQHGSSDILETLLDHDSCNVDIKNRLQGDTPLHIAVRNRFEDQPGLRLYLVGSLLESGADTTLRNRHNEKPADILPPASASADPESDDEKVRSMLRRAQAQASIAQSGDVVDDDDGEVDPDDVASDSD